MFRSFRTRPGLGLALLGGLLLLACSGVTVVVGDQATPTADLEATVAALAAQTVQAQAAAATTAAPAATSIPTVAPAPPTPVLTATLPPLPTATPQPTATPVPPVRFTATANVICRQGPGVYYPEVGILHAGDQVPVLAGTDAVEGYWLVQLPDGRTCWAWDRYATLEGDASTLPKATPPPAPDAAFSLFYVGFSECGANRGLTFEVVNRGAVPIESMELRLRDTVYSVTAGLQFQWWLDCSQKGSANTIYPGKSVWITLPTGSDDFRGHSITIDATACTADNLNGTCFERAIPFRP